MPLSKYAILEAMDRGEIAIAPFNPDNLNPQSIDLTLNSRLTVYSSPVLSPKSKNETVSFEIPDEGYILQPGELYIASVNEHTCANGYVGVVYGKSSLGRLGIFVHVTAGYVDSGYSGKLTLELAVVKPVRVFKNMKICQIAYDPEIGKPASYNGKYQGATEAEASKSYKDFKHE